MADDSPGNGTRRSFVKGAGAAVVAGLAGCQGQEGEGTASSTESDQTTTAGEEGTATDTKSNSLTTLSVRHFVNSHLETFYEEHAPILKREHGIEVEWETMGWGVAKQNQSNSITSRDGPDVEEIASTWMPQQVNSDGWMDLEEAGVQLPEDKIYDSPMKIGKYDGVTAGFPWFWGPRGHVYYKGLLETAGVDGPPGSWDEMISDAQTYNKQAEKWKDQGYNQRRLFGVPGANNWAVVQYYMMFLWQNGGDMLSNGEAAFNSDAGVEALNFYKNLAGKHKISPKASVEWNGPARNNAFKSQRIASTWQGLRVANQIDNPNETLGVAKPPAGPNGESSTFFGVNLMGIHPWTEKTDAAATFIEYLMQPKVNAGLAKGSGFLPTVKEGFQQEAFQGELYQTFANDVLQGTNAKTAPQVVGWGDVSGAVKSAITDVLTKSATNSWSEGDTKQALDKAAQQANNALQG